MRLGWRKVQKPVEEVAVEYETVYLVTDEVAVYRIIARVIFLVIATGLTITFIPNIWNRPLSKLARKESMPKQAPRWLALLLGVIMCIAGGYLVIAAIWPKYLAPKAISAQIDRYENCDYTTLVGSVESVEQVNKYHTVWYRISIGGHTFQCRYLRDQGHFDDVLTGTNDEVAKRFTQWLRNKTVRIRHDGDNILQLELGHVIKKKL